MNTLLTFMPIIILVIFVIIPGGILVLHDAFKQDIDKKSTKIKHHHPKAR